MTGETVWKNVGLPNRSLDHIIIRIYGNRERQIRITGEGTVDVKCGLTVLSLDPSHGRQQRCFVARSEFDCFSSLEINMLLYTSNASTELPSADIQTVGAKATLI